MTALYANRVGDPTAIARALRLAHPVPDWHEHAACRHVPPDLMFPTKTSGAQDGYRYAREVCRACPVRLPCLADALERCEPHGCWGGHSPDERVQVALGVRKP